MNIKTLKILAVIALVVGLLALLGQRMGGETSSVGASVGQLVLPELEDEIANVDQITVTGGGDQVLVTARREDSGWVIAEQDGYPADIGVIRDALTGLAEARIVEEKTSDPQFYSRLGVEDTTGTDATGITVTTAAGSTELPSVILGTSDNSNERYARLAGDALSLLVNRNPDFPREPSGWVVADILDLRSDRVQRVEIVHADSEQLVISKQTEDETSFTVENVPEDRELQYGTIANVTGNALRNLRLEAAAGVSLPEPQPVVTSEFWTFDGLVVTATSRTYDDEPWVSFDARFDAEQALRFATEQVDDLAAEDEGNDPESSDANAEAMELNARLAGWRYRVPSHIYDQMTRRMEDLLQAPAADETE